MKKTVQFQDKTLTQEEAAARFKQLCLESLEERHGQVTPEMEARLTRELNKIKQAENLQVHPFVGSGPP